jgi:hypothetical protein
MADRSRSDADQRVCVVFDVNPYRAMAYKATPTDAVVRARALKARESELNIVAGAAPTVIVELCNHLADPTDPEFDVCLGAVCALVAHCSFRRADGFPRLRLLPQTEALLCEPLYGAVPPILEEQTLQVRLMAHYISTDPTPKGIVMQSNYLASVAESVERLESAYADALRSLLTGWDVADPGARAAAREWLLGIPGRANAAGLLVRRARIALGIDHETDPLFAYNGLWVGEAYGVAIDFMVNAWGKMLDGADADNKRNLCWDAELAFLVGATAKTDDDDPAAPRRPVVLVTGDRDLRRASKRCTLPNRCQTLAEYRERIGWSPANVA